MQTIKNEINSKFSLKAYLTRTINLMLTKDEIKKVIVCNLPTMIKMSGCVRHLSSLSQFPGIDHFCAIQFSGL